MLPRFAPTPPPYGLGWTTTDTTALRCAFYLVKPSYFVFPSDFSRHALNLAFRVTDNEFGTRSDFAARFIVDASSGVVRLTYD
jgi:hypothetical protein